MADNVRVSFTIYANDSRVHYDDSWTSVAGSTSYRTTKPNATASLTFNGTLIQAFGVTGLAGAQADFKLDCISIPPLPLLPSDTSIPLFNPGLQNDTEHQFTLIKRNDNLPLILDHFLVTASPSKEPTGRPLPEYDQCAVPSMHPASPTTDDNVPSGEVAKHGLNPGLIAGVAIGVAIFLAAVVFLILFLVRRRRLYPKQISNTEKGFNIIELEPMSSKSKISDLFAFKRRRPTGSTPPVSNTRTDLTGYFSSVIIIPTFHPSTTSGSEPDTDRRHDPQ